MSQGFTLQFTYHCRKKLGVPVYTSRAILRTLGVFVAQKLQNGERVVVPGLGTFVTKQLKFNLGGGKQTVIRFRPSHKLRKSVKQNATIPTHTKTAE